MKAPRKTGYPCGQCSQEYLCPPTTTPKECGALRREETKDGLNSSSTTTNPGSGIEKTDQQ